MGLCLVDINLMSCYHSQHDITSNVCVILTFIDVCLLFVFLCMALIFVYSFLLVFSKAPLENFLLHFLGWNQSHVSLGKKEAKTVSICW